MRIEDVLKRLRYDARDKRALGDAFERLIRSFLKTAPEYARRFQEVWLWKDCPHLASWGLTAQDRGIDLVALDEEGFCAIQCKFFSSDESVNQQELGNFYSLSGKAYPGTTRPIFSSRIVVSTTENWSAHAEDLLRDQSIPSTRINLVNLEESGVDWGQFVSPDAPLPLLPKKSLYPYQENARTDVLEGLKAHSRGKLIMACGTGKTLTGLRIVEEIVPLGGSVLFAVPSITLLSQTLREWARESLVPMRFFAVCSDTRIGKDEEDLRVYDLAYPATTAPQKLACHASKSYPKGITAILTTYQSMDVIRKAQGMGLPPFDFVLCDEAHRTTGIELSYEAKESVIAQKKRKAENAGGSYTPQSEAGELSSFMMVHEDAYVQARKRLYMTATPRIFTEKTKKRASENEALVYSMDDETRFGPTLHTLSFGNAVQQKILSDFKVIIVAMTDERMQELANAYSLESGKAIQARFAAKIVGAWKALAKEGVTTDDGHPAFDPGDPPMKSGVAFSHTIKSSKELAACFQEVVNLYLDNHGDGLTCHFEHVDGGMNIDRRLERIRWLDAAQEASAECRVLTNARCLSEGVDVPSLDAVLFFDARDSMVDVVQSVGRVMRKTPIKTFGYIILPVGIPSDRIADLDGFIESDPQFKNIWKVLKALRAHDERLVDDSEYRKRISVITGDDRERNRNKPDMKVQPINFPPIPVDQLGEAVYGVIPQKLGDREYWQDWSRDVARTAETIEARVMDVLKDPEAKSALEEFGKEIRQTMNPKVSDPDLVDMLVQHIITRPVFEALFPSQSFIDSNPMSQAMQRILWILDRHGLHGETSGLDKFYQNVRERVSLAKSDKSRQDVIRNLYDTFFQAAFPKLSDRLGIVYTPVEVVDFIIRSADFALRKDFGVGLSDHGVNILDPFAGTGTFLSRLIQSGIISPDRLPDKYHEELHATELVLLAYYIASLNIESAFLQVSGESLPFPGMVLGDTFQMGEGGKSKIFPKFLEENNARADRQNQADIRVIIGNPPYRANQGDSNQNNQNLSYEKLDKSIRDTYAAHSTATLKNSLYDSYIRAFRWACNRIRKQGVICYVTNGGWIDGNTMDGFRKTLAEEFTSIYVFNLRGNQRTSGELSRKEGGKIFGSGSRAPIAITLLVKNPWKQGPCEIYYHDIGDYLSREEKLAKVVGFGSIEKVHWEKIIPNDHHDWINARSEEFGSLVPLNDGPDSIFTIRSRGVATSRDTWVYNFSLDTLQSNMEKTVRMYEAERTRLKGEKGDLANLVRYDPTQIKWEREMLLFLKRNVPLVLTEDRFRIGVYRPFSKKNLCFGDIINNCDYQMPSIFPSPDLENLAISVTSTGETKDFSCLISSVIPDLHLLATTQCFPLYVYEKPQGGKNRSSKLFKETPQDENFVKKDAITDAALENFRSHYKDAKISKEDLFYYVYGVLHSPEYREQYTTDLKKMLPRVPFVPDFLAFSEAGRKLASWHLNYETVDPWKDVKIEISQAGKSKSPEDLYKVTKMRFGKTFGGSEDKSVIQFNDHITISGIPIEPYEYVVNGKSAIDWIMEQYQVYTDKETGITNDPNMWCKERGDPLYIFNLVLRIIRVSMETMKIVKGLPSLGSGDAEGYGPASFGGAAIAAEEI
ncbi:MAG: type ISP restriction/modification enzyme [Leptospirillum sp.]